MPINQKKDSNKQNIENLYINPRNQNPINIITIKFTNNGFNFVYNPRPFFLNGRKFELPNSHLHNDGSFDRVDSMRKTILILSVIIGSIYGGGVSQATNAHQKSSYQATVIRVVDGDSMHVELMDGQKKRWWFQKRKGIVKKLIIYTFEVYLY